MRDVRSLVVERVQNGLAELERPGQQNVVENKGEERVVRASPLLRLDPKSHGVRPLFLVFGALPFGQKKALQRQMVLFNQHVFLVVQLDVRRDVTMENFIDEFQSAAKERRESDERSLSRLLLFRLLNVKKNENGEFPQADIFQLFGEIHVQVRVVFRGQRFGAERAQRHVQHPTRSLCDETNNVDEGERKTSVDSRRDSAWKTKRRRENPSDKFHRCKISTTSIADRTTSFCRNERTARARSVL